MNPTTGLEAPAKERIDDRIARLGRGRRNAAARRELRDHVVQSATDLAGGGAVGIQHVDAAFDALGEDADIRAAFFPRPRAAVGRVAAGILVAASLLVVAAVLAEDGGTGVCVVEGEGRCTASAGGAALDVVLYASPPLLALALLLRAPAWSAAALAVAFVAMTVARLDAAVGRLEAAEVAIAAAATATLAVAVRHAWLERRLLHA